MTGGLAFGMQLGDKEFSWRPEVMAGYKQVFGGADDVSAAFDGGSSFTLNPASQKGGAIAHVGIHGGNKYSDFAFEAGGRGPRRLQIVRWPRRRKIPVLIVVRSSKDG